MNDMSDKDILDMVNKEISDLCKLSASSGLDNKDVQQLATLVKLRKTLIAVVGEEKTVEQDDNIDEVIDKMSAEELMEFLRNDKIH